MKRRLLVLVVLLNVATGFNASFGQQGIAFNEQRPFVVGVVPVVSGRSVGGVAVDSNGVISRADTRDLAALRDAHRATLQGYSDDVGRPSKLRKVSLRRLDAILAQHADGNEMLPSEVLCLAGLSTSSRTQRATISCWLALPKAGGSMTPGISLDKRQGLPSCS